jgi:hypothetical protein
MPLSGNRWREPGFILDAVQTTVAIMVALVLALDMTGVFSSVPWLHDNLPELTFIAICLLIVSSFLERRITLEGLREMSRESLEDTLLGQQEISKQIAGLAASDIRLGNRLEFRMSFERQLAHAKAVAILGLNLSRSSASKDYLYERARAGCKFRILLAEPDSPAQRMTAGTADEAVRQRDLENSIRKLEPLLETGNVKLRYLPVVPPFSLLIIDPEDEFGIVQVELFVYGTPTSERPHFVLTKANQKRWFDFFMKQFDLLWTNSRPHGVPVDTGVTHPKAGLA